MGSPAEFFVAGPSHDLAQRRAAQLQAAASQGVLLAIEGQVIDDLADQHVRSEAEIEAAARRRRGRRGGLLHAVFVWAGVLRPHDYFHEYAGRLQFDPLVTIFADPHQRFAATFAASLMLFQIDEHFFTRQVRRQLAPTVAATTPTVLDLFRRDFGFIAGLVVAWLIKQSALSRRRRLPLDDPRGIWRRTAPKDCRGDVTVRSAQF